MSSENAVEIATVEDAAGRSAGDIGRAIDAKRLDPRELTERYLARAAETPDVYVRTTPERARAEAAAAYDRAQRGVRRGPLDGVPISWKDLFDVAGVPTEAGTKIDDRPTPAHDCPAVAEAARAGAVCLGKTHLSELAFSGLGYNPVAATSPNAFDAARVPGGSSSGAAASVAFDLAAASVGSDTGGSVRIPSAWNGLVGLKTTHGLISLEGARPLSHSLDTAGPLVRSVEDAGLMVSAMTGASAPDLSGATLKGVSLFVCETITLDDVAPELLAGFEASVERFAAAGATITRGPVPEFAELFEVIERHGAIIATEGYANWKDQIEARPEAMFPMILERFRSGAAFSGVQLDLSKREVARVRRSYLQRMAGYDAVLAPTTPNVAPLVADIASDEETYVRENLRALRNTRIGNLLNLCALTLPAGRTPSGHPIATMAFAAPYAEPKLLRIGAAMETALASATA